MATRVGGALAAVLLAGGVAVMPSSASAQQTYAMEFNQSVNYFGTVNLLTGAFTAINAEGGTLYNDIAAAPDGTLYGVVNASTLVTINPVTGATANSVAFNVGGIESIAISADGTLYGATQGGLYTLNASTGAATLVGNFNNNLIGNSGQNIRFAGDGKLYDTNGGVDPLNTDLFQISLLNGYASTVGVIANFPGLCLENSGTTMYGVGIQLGTTSTLYQDLVGIDLGSAAAGGTNTDGSVAPINYVLVTANFPNNYNFSASATFTVPGTPIVSAPEPGVGASFIAGAMVLVALNMRQRR